MKAIIERFLRNMEGFWRAYWIWIAVFSAGVIFDGASTIYFMVRDGGAGNELHPGIQLVSEWFGPVAGPVLGAAGKIIACVAVAIYWRRIAAYLFGFGAALSLWAGWYNIWGVELYVPRVLMWLWF